MRIVDKAGPGVGAEEGLTLDYAAEQMAFRKAGQESKATQLLEVLAYNAIVEHRYNDAG
jgi:hypothetical protein